MLIVFMCTNGTINDELEIMGNGECHVISQRNSFPSAFSTILICTQLNYQISGGVSSASSGVGGDLISNFFQLIENEA